MDASLAAPDAAGHSKPRTARFYEPELDALRFFAFFSVFCYHTLPGDFSHLEPKLGHAIPAMLLAARNATAFGVCMFFLLSSYLITKLLILERQATGSIHMKSFYIRRILRIWPLYLTFLFAMWFLGRIGVFFPVETGRLLAFLFFSGNIYSGIWGFTFNPILPLWTVSIEEQFYILWPALARCGLKVLEAGAWVLVGVAIVSTVVLRSVAVNPVLAVWTNSLTHFQFFALGALFAVRYAAKLPAFSTLARVALAIAGMASLMVATGPLHLLNAEVPVVSPPLFAAGYELMAVGIALVFLAVLGSAQGKFKVPGVLTYLGKISYGLYVFHDLSLQVCGAISNRYNMPTGFRFAGSAAMTLLLAMLSYRFFEKPFLVLKDRFALIQTRPA